VSQLPLAFYDDWGNMANFEYEFWFTPNAALIRTTTFSESYRYPVGVYIVAARGN